MFHQMLLGLAIVAGITGVPSMKQASVNHGNSGFILMLVMIALSYTFLSSAVRRIALDVAYTSWEDIGILFTTSFSVLLFDETLSMMRAAKLISLVLDIMLIKSDT